MIQFGDLFQSLAAKIVGDSVRRAEAQTEKLMQARRAMCMDYYNGAVLAEDGGRDSYLRDHFTLRDATTNALKEDKYKGYEHVPVTKLMIDNKARIYTCQPERKIQKETETEDATEYSALLKLSGWYGKSKYIERLAQLLGELAVGVHYDENKGRLYYTIVTEYTPYYASDDELQEEPVGLLYPSALRGKNGEQLYRWWDAEKKLTLDASGAQVGVAEDNPYGILPFFFAKREEGLSSPRTNLIMANRAIDVAMTALNRMLQRPGYTQLVATGDIDGASEAGSSFAAGMNRLVIIKNAPGETAAATLEALKVDVDIAQQIAGIQGKLEFVGQMMNMAFQWKLDGGGVQSGKALQVQNVRDLDDRSGQIDQWDATIEQPMYEITKAISGVFGLGVEDGELVVEFKEQESGFPDTNSEIAWNNWQMQTGLMSPVDFMLEDNPDMDEDEAAKKIENNVKLYRAITAGPPDDLEQTILSILNDTDTGTDNPGAPTGAAGSTRPDQDGVEGIVGLGG